jgi:predicted lipoprotein with Yx(FWY)xxD motif
MAETMRADESWPLHPSVKDIKPGEMTGEGVGGVRHAVKAE